MEKTEKVRIYLETSVIGEIPTTDSMTMIREIRDKIYEETQHLTLEEKKDYYERELKLFQQRSKQLNPDDYDLSFLTLKK